jgi:hypothetical protein
MALIRRRWTSRNPPCLYVELYGQEGKFLLESHRPAYPPQHAERVPDDDFARPVYLDFLVRDPMGVE